MYEFETFLQWLEFNPDQKARVRDSLATWQSKNRKDWLAIVFQAKEEDYWDPVSFPHLAALKKWAIEEEQLSTSCNQCSLKEKEIESLQVSLIDLQAALETNQSSNLERVALKRENDNLQRQLNSFRTSNQQLTQKHLEELRVRGENCKRQKEELSNKIRELEGKLEGLRVDSKAFLELEDKVEELENSLQKVKEKVKEWRELIEGRGKREVKRGWWW